MKKTIIYIIILAFSLELYTCKPRRSDSGLSSVEEAQKEDVTRLAFAVGMRSKLRREPAMHFADNSAAKIFDELLKNANESNNQSVRMQNLSAIADISAVAPSWIYVVDDSQKSQPNARIPTAEYVLRAIQQFQLKAPITRECRARDNAPTGRQTFHMCADFIQCSQAATLLTSFSRKSWSDPRIIDEVRKRNQLLAQDLRNIECTDGVITRALLEHKHQSMMVWQEFNLESGIEDPEALGMQPRMNQGKLAELKQRLDNLINNVEKNLLHNEIERAVPQELMRKFLLEEIMSPNILPASLAANGGNNSSQMDNSDKFEQAWSTLEKDQQDTVLELFETTFSSALDTHDANIRLRVYLDRINQSNIRPWLACLNKRVNSYINQFEYSDSNKIIRNVLPSDDPQDQSCLSRALSPSVAMRTLSMFLRQEMLLPDRRFYFTEGLEMIGRKLIGNTKGIERPADSESKFDPISEIAQTAAEFLNATDSMNADFYQILSSDNPEFFPPFKAALNSSGRVANASQTNHPILGSDPNGTPYEQKLASSLDGYHSLFYQLYRLQDKMNNLHRSYTIQRCIMSDVTLEPMQKDICKDIGYYNDAEDKFQKKQGDGWVEFTNEEKKEASQKLNMITNELQVQTAVQGCAAKQYAAPQQLPNRIRLLQKSKQPSDRLAEKLGFNPWGCWQNVVYNLNTRQIAQTLFYPSTMMSSQFSEFPRTPSPSSMGNPADFAIDSIDHVFKKVGLEELTRNTNTDHFFKEIPFRPSADGYFNMNDICMARGLQGQSRPSMFNYYNSVGRWLSAQNVYDKCHEVTMEMVTTILGAVTMPGIGKVTHAIIGKLLWKFPGIITRVGATHHGITQAASQGRVALIKYLATNPAALRMSAALLLKQLPYGMANLSMNVAVFTLLNKALYSSLYLQKFYDHELSLWQNLGHEMLMGVWFMGGMPAVHKMSSILFPGPVSKFLGTGYAAAQANFTLSVGLEATFFRYVGPVAEWATEKAWHKYHLLTTGEPPPPHVDDSWMHEKGEMYEWGHALMMTLVFRVGRNNLQDNHAQVYNAQMARMKSRYYKARQSLGLKTFDPYKKDSALAQNPYSDLFIDLGKVNYKNQAEMARLAEEQYNKIINNEIKDPHGQGYGEKARHGDPVAMRVVAHASHALETLRNPQAKNQVDRMLERAAKKSGVAFKDLSSGDGSIFTTPLEHYRILGLEYRGPGALNQGMLNGKYQSKRQEIEAQIRREESNMTVNKPQNDPRRIPYQERIAELKDQLRQLEASYQLLSNPQRKAEIDYIISDPQMQRAMQARIDQAKERDAYLFD